MDLDWRRRPESNRGWRFCRPLPYRLATAPSRRASTPELKLGPTYLHTKLGPTCERASDPTYEQSAGQGARPRSEPASELERETGFEPATSTLARSHSTTELFPLSPGCRTPNVLQGSQPVQGIGGRARRRLTAALDLHRLSADHVGRGRGYIVSGDTFGRHAATMRHFLPSLPSARP